MMCVYAQTALTRTVYNALFRIIKWIMTFTDGVIAFLNLKYQSLTQLTPLVNSISSDWQNSLSLLERSLFL